MKRLAASLFLVSLVFATSRTDAEEPPAKLRILLTYGGHGFEEEPFFAFFDGLPNVTYSRAEMPKDAGLLKPGLQNEYDAIVMYDMVRGITPQQQKAFVDLLQEGIGVVSLHHNLGAHRDWDEFTKMIGGKFVFGDCVLEGESYTKSTWSHGEQLQVKVADPKHAITEGLSDFEIHDESYGGYYTSSGVHVLLTTDHAKNDPELAWTTSYGKSRVFFLMLGHDHHAWQNPAYGTLVSRGIRWVAGK